MQKFRMQKSHLFFGKPKAHFLTVRLLISYVL